MPEQFADVRFPTRGLDQSRGFWMQQPGTTREGVNVIGFEPLADRLRGGMRPGLSKYVSGQVPSGSHVLQDLNFIVTQDATRLPTSIDLGWPDFVYDPSSPGPPTSWGWTPLLGPSGDPLVPLTTGETQGTRNPAPPGGNPRKVRRGGTAETPNKNVLQYAPSVVATYVYEYLFTIRLVGGVLDGLEREFQGSQCFAPTVPPQSAFVFSNNAHDPTAELQPKIDAAIADYNAHGFGVVTYVQVSDQVFGPFAQC